MVVECVERGDRCVYVSVCARARSLDARRGLGRNSSDKMPRAHEAPKVPPHVCVWCMGRENAPPLAGITFDRGCVRVCLCSRARATGRK